MTVLLTLEASQPSGKTFRLGLGCNPHLGLDASLAVEVVLTTRATRETGWPLRLLIISNSRFPDTMNTDAY